MSDLMESEMIVSPNLEMMSSNGGLLGKWERFVLQI